MENKNIFKQRLILPISILFGCIVLGGFIYASQISKQNSIERQQEFKLQEIRRQNEEIEKQENIEKELRLEYERSAEELKINQNACNDLSIELKKEWSNVLSVNYDNNLWKECVVTYIDEKTGEIKSSPISNIVGLDNSYNYYKVSISQDEDCNIKKKIIVDTEIINIPSQDYEKFVILSFTTGRDIMDVSCPKGYHITECSGENFYGSCRAERYSYDKLKDSFTCKKMDLYIFCERN